MSFNILYIEHDQYDYDQVQKAIVKFNNNDPSEPLNICQARNLYEFNNKLSLDFDVILADVMFPVAGPKTGKEYNTELLADIILCVKNWGNKNNGGRPLPIIAYSGEDTLDYSLLFIDNLYDIWDKNTTSPEYVVWRLSRLAIEVSRFQPDSCLQHLIRTMPQGAKWHNKVVEMTQRYNSGWTESDQIERAGKAIEDIAYELDVWDHCEPLWKVMKDWEPLSRAISRKARGHARHVINVFWLGYYIIHHECMREWFAENWQTLVKNRSKMADVGTEEPLEALSNIWFLAGIFHDIGACIEKSMHVYDCHRSLLKVFEASILSPSERKELSFAKLSEKGQNLLYEIGDPLKKEIEPIIKESIKKGKPDHGFSGALHLFNTISEGKQQCYAREAARSIALHNVIGSVNPQEKNLLSWKEEPIGCLLILCDQIQT